jgi:hypothetical protein
LIPDADQRAIACAEAIRSVTHLVLAPDRETLFIKSFPVFFFVFLAIDLVRPSRFQRDQKTFSAGPCSFRSLELWFGRLHFNGTDVQPVFDSRHGRITGKTFFQQFQFGAEFVLAERARLQSEQRA